MEITEIVKELSINVFLVVILAFIYNFFTPVFKKARPLLSSIILGIMAGGVSLLCMTFPIDLGSGIILDSRNIVALMAGYFFGPLAAIISFLIAAVYRLYIGGAGVIPGIILLFVSTTIGLFFRWRKPVNKCTNVYPLFLLMGILVGVSTILLCFILPPDLIFTIMAKLWRPVLVAYPLGSIVTGSLLYSMYLKNRNFEKSVEKENLLSTTFKAVPDALVVLSDSHSIISMNENAVALFQANNSAQTDENFIHMKLIVDRKKETTLSQIIKDQKGIIRNLRVQIGSFTTKQWFLISASPLTFYDNSTGVVVIIRDITTEVEQEYNLIQAQKMDVVGQLASGIAHDFNNMLAGIQGAADLLRTNAREDQKEMLNLIITATDKASKLTKELLVFTRKSPSASTAIDVHAIIKETTFILGRTINKGIAISTDLKADNALVVGDDTLIQSALMNMGINASHAMPDGGTLTFITSVKELDELYCTHSPFEIVPGKYLSIEINDTGCGMSFEVQKRIFEPFFTTKEVGKGTGLGMAAVYSMVVKHNGAITVYSEEGTGTMFHILLPLAEKSVEKLKEASKTTLHGSGTVLVVDDEEFIRITTTELLRNLGYTTFAVQNGQEALEFLAKQSVDLVLIDMIMPVMNGRETFEKIIELGINTKVILASGFCKDEDVAIMKEKGLFGFLQKPYQRSELSKIVYKAVTS